MLAWVRRLIVSVGIGGVSYALMLGGVPRLRGALWDPSMATPTTFVPLGRLRSARF